MEKYVAQRDNVYAGLLMYKQSICRAMLFQIDKEGLANDLIYTTPTNYPIDSNLDNDFFIKKYVALDELLRYLQYEENLTQKDLLVIYKKLIANNRWISHHLELFGYNKLCGGYGYACDESEVIPNDIYCKLEYISNLKNTRPKHYEPNYFLIRKRR